MANDNSILGKRHHLLDSDAKKQKTKAVETKKVATQKASTPRVTRTSTAFKKAEHNPFDVASAHEAYTNKVNAQRAEFEFRSTKVDRMDERYKKILSMLFRYTAAGNFDNQEELFFSRFDRFGNSLLTPNVEHSGLTFFTRPKLPLTAGNLINCPTLATLNTLNPSSRAFAIRCWLDTHFTGNHVGYERMEVPGKISAATLLAQQKNVIDAIVKCPYFDMDSAFLIPLCNSCVSQSGWPDPFIQTFTTTGGYFCEDQTFAIGSDRLRKTYDINFTFREGPGAPILALLYTWYEVMACLAEGSMVAYAEDIDAQRLCYTCSIYRFILDPSKTHITHYAKATGCFPKAPPMGALFNQSRGEINIQAANEVSIPFVANKVEYDDPRILLDFNFVASRYCPNISTYPILRPEPYNNFKGYPFVISTGRGLELTFREPPDRPYYDEKAKKMYATTREKFEQHDLFYGDKEIADIQRGPETRYEYRVRKSDDGKDLIYVQDSDDDYDTSAELSARLKSNVYMDDNTMTPINTYKGTTDIGSSDSTSSVESIITDPELDPKYGTKSPYVATDRDGNVVSQFDPVVVNGDDAGKIDVAARNRANETVNVGTRLVPIEIPKGNRDIVDAGTNPNPVHTKDHTKTSLSTTSATKTLKSNKV